MNVQYDYIYITYLFSRLMNLSHNNKIKHAVTSGFWTIKSVILEPGWHGGGCGAGGRGEGGRLQGHQGRLGGLQDAIPQ